jgi:hypothetical protein
MTTILRRDAILALGATAMASLSHQSQAQSQDPLSLQGNVGDQIVGPLSQITIRTSDGDAYRRFLQGGMGMTPLTTGFDVASAQRWGVVPPASQTIVYQGPTAATSRITVRVIEGAVAGGPILRPDYDALLPGALSIGIPVHNIDARAKILAAYGFPATAGVTDITRWRAVPVH